MSTTLITGAIFGHSVECSLSSDPMFRSPRTEDEKGEVIKRREKERRS